MQRTDRTPRGVAFLAVLALAWITLAGTPDPALSKAADGGSKKTAFVVGNSGYRHISALSNPKRDAAAIAKALERVGFDVTTVIDGDRVGMLRALDRFAKHSIDADIALFFFAGHGIQINGENYLLPISVKAAVAEAILAQGVSLNEVRNAMQAANPGLSIFMLDSCRENPFGPIATRRTSETAAPLSIGRGLAQMDSAAGMLIAYATQPGKLAYDGQGDHSPFTASLLRYLEEPGIDIRLMLGRVREDVVSKTGGQQIPWVEEAVLGEFYFAEPGVEVGAKRSDDEVVFWRSVWRSTDPKDYEAYLARYPDGAFAKLAANRLSALKVSARRPATSEETAQLEALGSEDWRLVKNSLYWLGYYNGPLNGVPDNTVTASIRAYQTSIQADPDGGLTVGQIERLHDSAAISLISLGERLSDRIVFDRARLRSIERGITDIALPAYNELKRRLAGDPKGRPIVDEARLQVESMRRRLDEMQQQYKRVSQQYMTVVAATGATYEQQARSFRTSTVRGGATERIKAGASRRQLFLRHALSYAEKGGLDEKGWLEEIQ